MSVVYGCELESTYNRVSEQPHVTVLVGNTKDGSDHVVDLEHRSKVVTVHREVNGSRTVGFHATTCCCFHPRWVLVCVIGTSLKSGADRRPLTRARIAMCERSAGGEIAPGVNVKLPAGGPFDVFRQRGKQKVFTERVLVRRPRLFSRLWCVCFCLFCSLWCDGSACVWGIHTNHPSVERLGSVDAPVVAMLVMATVQSWFQEEICSVCLRSHGTPPQTAPGVPASGIDPAWEELQQIGDVAGIFSWLGSDEPWRTAPIRVLDAGQLRLRDRVYVPADM